MNSKSITYNWLKKVKTKEATYVSYERKHNDYLWLTGDTRKIFVSNIRPSTSLIRRAFYESYFYGKYD